MIISNSAHFSCLKFFTKLIWLDRIDRLYIIFCNIYYILKFLQRNVFTWKKLMTYEVTFIFLYSPAFNSLSEINYLLVNIIVFIMWAIVKNVRRRSAAEYYLYAVIRDEIDALWHSRCSNVESSKADTSKGSKYKRSLVVVENIYVIFRKIASKTILLSQERAELVDRRKVSPLHVPIGKT